jgi:ABC-2 type transport system permease protein
MRHLILLIIIIIGALVRVGFAVVGKKKKTSVPAAKVPSSKPSKPISPRWRPFWTVLVFTKLSTRRFFRDKLALYFGIMFPLIFLFVFGSFSSGNGAPSFSVAVFNQSGSAFSKTFVNGLEHSKVFKVDKSAQTLASAKTEMTNKRLDAIIVLPSGFGTVNPVTHKPTGQVQVLYSATSASTGQTVQSIIGSVASGVSSQLIKQQPPVTASGHALQDKQLTAFDYTFSGLLGFSIVGAGIFGPINVFPELKKQGILRRLHNTPLKVWQYFLATMFSQAITSIVAIAVQFIVAVLLFGLKVDGDYLEIIAFTVLSIFMILGIGLSIGGWAKNERQAAPLANIIVFPMLFLSGTFVPQYDLPVWLQSITKFLPLSPVIDGLRLLTTAGYHLWQIGPDLGLVAAWLVVVYAIAFRVFRWE